MLMTRISEVLKKSKANQITRGLVRPMDQDYSNPNAKIMGYCALGVLACNKHKFKNYGTFDKWYKEIEVSSGKFTTDRYNHILNEYGVPKDLLSINFIDELDFMTGEDGLANLIYKLNDMIKMSFSEIGEFLEICLDL